MVFILNQGVSIESVTEFRKEFEDQGFSTIYAPGTEHTAVCLLGNTAAIDMDAIVATHSILEQFDQLMAEVRKRVVFEGKAL